MSKSFEETERIYESLYPGSPFFATWVPKDGFISSEYDGQANLSVTRTGEKSFGFALGSHPIINPEWESCSIESIGISHISKGLKVVDQWDCYWAETVSAEIKNDRIASDLEIEEFLKIHAPDSSVFPGNKEILQWVQIHEGDQLRAVAALCRWESGRVVISSVATHSEARGQGFGSALMKKVLATGTQLGEKYLSLGVLHQNESAQRLYARSGFTLMHHFTYCERR